MSIMFKRLCEVPLTDIHALLNNPILRKHMPLAKSEYSLEEAAAFVQTKDGFWVEHGYGPWAFFYGGKFAGWGGLQPEGKDIDLGLVLLPEFWGLGPEIYRKILRFAFQDKNFSFVTVLLPLSRSRISGLARLGFVRDGGIEIAGHFFCRYKLEASHFNQ